MERLKSPLNLLILIGLICQGKSVENYNVVILYCLLWGILLTVRFKKRFTGDNIEFVILLFALLGFYYFAGNNIFEKCISLGNALAILQLIRLTYKLDYRRKILAMGMALTQIAIGTQVFLDYSFLIVLLCAVVLIPKAFYEIQAESYDAKYSLDFKKHKIEYSLILILSVIFFLFFPRINFKSSGYLYSELNAKKNVINLTKPKLKTSLPVVSEKDLKSNEVVFQVLAENLKYFKTLTMDEFNGDLWSISAYGYMKRRDFRRRQDLTESVYRKVDIKYDDYKSRFLPIDGNVDYIEGNFFEDPVLTRIGNIVIPENLSRSNKTYEYWTNLNSISSKLSIKEIKRFTQVPVQSKRLKEWLNNVIKGKVTDYEKAVTVCTYLQNNFKYELGGPKLDVKYPIEDFIFNRKSGHCERFASALAALLRMLKIPSNLCIGFLVRDKNEIGGYYNVRVLDAHAWVEAYFEGKGWITLDATPAGNYDFQSLTVEKSAFEKYSDYIEFLWYSKIVNLSYGDQIFIFRSIGKFIKYIGYIIEQIFIYLVLVVLLIFIAFICFTFRKINIKLTFFKLKNRKRIKKIEHFYDRMLNILQNQGFYRAESMTPKEFLILLKNRNYEMFDTCGKITEYFYSMKYGQTIISDREFVGIENMLKNLSKNSDLK